MNIRTRLGLIFSLLGLVSITLLTSCEDRGRNVFVINEVMSSNKTTILSADGKAHDWIEIRNVSTSPANLKGYSLASDSGAVTWTFPDTVIQPEQCILVFATDKDLKGQLHCDFKISSKGDTIQLLTKRGNLANEIIYNKLKADQVVKYTKIGKCKKSYNATPGFENNSEGRMQYFEVMEKQRTNPLRIWEFMEKIPKEQGGRRWIEVKNTSNKTIDLSSYYLTDDLHDGNKLTFEKKQLAPGEIAAVTDEKKVLDGECVILSKSGEFLDGVCAGNTYLGVSIGRKQGQNGFYYFDNPTFEKENTTPGYIRIAEEPEFKVVPGIYAKDKMTVTLKTHDLKVYYTIDGSQPTEKSSVYKNGISIDSSAVVHAFAVDKEALRSKAVTGTFLLRVKHTLPVMSLTMQDSDLYDYNKGIYVKGPNAEVEKPYDGANFWQPWEKVAHIEFFDGKDGFSYDCGVKIFGAYSRAREKKSFQIKFARRYGQSSLKYDLYGNGKEEEVKSFVLRSGSQDDRGVMVRDEFFTSLMAEHCPNLYVQAYRPVALYINKVYFGLYYIREKVNEEYVANHLNVKKKSVTLLLAKGASEIGSNAEYRALEEYARTHDMNDETAYKYMDDHIDFMSLIDHKIGEFYTGNCDVGNVRFFKSSDKSCDNKWHWIYFDLDWGFYYNTPLSFYIRENAMRHNGTNNAGYNLFINRLLRNPKFRKMFLERWAYHMQNTFCEKNAVGHFNDMINTIKPEMVLNCERWKSVMTFKSWEKNVDKFRQKIIDRPAIIHQQFLNELSVTEKEKQTYFNFK